VYLWKRCSVCFNNGALWGKLFPLLSLKYYICIPAVIKECVIAWHKLDSKMTICFFICSHSGVDVGVEFYGARKSSFYICIIRDSLKACLNAYLTQ